MPRKVWKDLFKFIANEEFPSYFIIDASFILVILLQIYYYFVIFLLKKHQVLRKPAISMFLHENLFEAKSDWSKCLAFRLDSLA